MEILFRLKVARMTIILLTATICLLLKIIILLTAIAIHQDQIIQEIVNRGIITRLIIITTTRVPVHTMLLKIITITILLVPVIVSLDLTAHLTRVEAGEVVAHAVVEVPQAEAVEDITGNHSNSNR